MSKSKRRNSISLILSKRRRPNRKEKAAILQNKKIRISKIKMRQKLEEKKRQALLMSESLAVNEKYKIPDDVYSLGWPSSRIGQEPTNPSILTEFSFSYKDYIYKDYIDSEGLLAEMNDEDSEVGEDELEESDIELEGDVVVPSNDPHQQMGDPSVDVEGKLEKALEHLTQAILLNPTSADMYAKRATVYIKMKKPNAAIRDANAALAKNKVYAKGYKSRGLAQAMLGKWDEADSDLYVASKLDYDEEIGVALKKVQRKAYMTENDRRKYDRLRKIKIISSYWCTEPQKMGDPSVEVSEENRKFSWEWKEQAVKAFSKGKLDEAREHLTQAILLNPASENLYVARATVNMKRKKPTLAINDATAALKLNPSCAGVYKLRGFAKTMGRDLYEDAVEDLQQALALGHDEEVKDMLKRIERSIHAAQELERKFSRVRTKLEFPGMSRSEISKDSELMDDLQDSRILIGFQYDAPPLAVPFAEKYKTKRAQLLREQKYRNRKERKVKKGERDRQRHHAYAEAVKACPARTCEGGTGRAENAMEVLKFVCMQRMDLAKREIEKLEGKIQEIYSDILESLSDTSSLMDKMHDYGELSHYVRCIGIQQEKALGYGKEAEAISYEMEYRFTLLQEVIEYSTDPLKSLSLEASDSFFLVFTSTDLLIEWVHMKERNVINDLSEKLLYFKQSFTEYEDLVVSWMSKETDELSDDDFDFKISKAMGRWNR